MQLGNVLVVPVLAGVAAHPALSSGREPGGCRVRLLLPSQAGQGPGPSGPAVTVPADVTSAWAGRERARLRLRPCRGCGGVGFGGQPVSEPAGSPGHLDLATVVCLSRVYVGAHWPLDLIGGAAVGFAVGAVVHLLLGAPGGNPSAGRVRRALVDSRFEPDEVVAQGRPDAPRSARFLATTTAGSGCSSSSSRVSAGTGISPTGPGGGSPGGPQATRGALVPPPNRWSGRRT